jgi:hypothetical protein
MDSILLRKLTKKSILNFGKFKKCSVEQLFGMRKERELIAIYYKLSTITFTDDILCELGIKEEYRIKKPSKNLETYKQFMMMRYGRKHPPKKELENMRKKTAPYKKKLLQSFNQGHK